MPACSQLQTAYCQVLTIQCKTFSLCNFHFNLFVYLCTSVYNFLRQRSLIKKCSYKSPTNLHSGHPFLRAICNKTNLASSSKLDKKNLPKLTETCDISCFCIGKTKLQRCSQNNQVVVKTYDYILGFMTAVKYIMIH